MMGKDLNEELFKAVAVGDTSRFRLLIKQGAEVNSVNEEGDTPLLLAAKRCRASTVELLAKQNGTDVNRKDKSGYTSLYHAVCNGRTTIAKLLLDKGAKVKSNDAGGNPLLHIATKIGHAPIVTLLLGKGAEVNGKNRFGYTALHWAAEKGFESIVKILLEEKAEVDSQDQYGDTALHLAAEKSYKPIVERLLGAGAEVNRKNKIGITPLHEAAYGGHEAVVECLLEKGAEVNSQDQTPLMYAARRGCTKIVERLLAAGAEVNSKIAVGDTLIAYADIKGNTEKIDKKDSTQTALICAAEGGHMETVNLLLVNGAQVNDDTLRLATGAAYAAIVAFLKERVNSPSSRQPNLIQALNGIECVPLALGERNHESLYWPTLVGSATLTNTNRDLSVLDTER